MVSVNSTNFRNAYNSYQSNSAPINRKPSFQGGLTDSFQKQSKENNGLLKKIAIGAGIIAGLAITAFAIIKNRKANSAKIKNEVKIIAEKLDTLNPDDVIKFFDQEDVAKLKKENPKSSAMLIDLDKLPEPKNVDMASIKDKIDKNSSRHIIATLYDEQKGIISGLKLFNCNTVHPDLDKFGEAGLIKLT